MQLQNLLFSEYVATNRGLDSPLSCYCQTCRKQERACLHAPNIPIPCAFRGVHWIYEKRFGISLHLWSELWEGGVCRGDWSADGPIWRKKMDLIKSIHSFLLIIVHPRVHWDSKSVAVPDWYHFRSRGWGSNFFKKKWCHIHQGLFCSKRFGLFGLIYLINSLNVKSLIKKKPKAHPIIVIYPIILKFPHTCSVLAIELLHKEESFTAFSERIKEFPQLWGNLPAREGKKNFDTKYSSI